MTGRRRRLGGILIVALATCVWFWWASRQHDFLPSDLRAEWILYPAPPNTEMHTAVPIWTVFTRNFTVTNTSEKAMLSFRAFRNVQISLNGQVAGLETGIGTDWKKLTTLDVSKMLKIGSNTLSVTVTNSHGPPALWATLEAKDFLFATDSRWKASIVGSVWMPAQIAGEEIVFQNGNRLSGAETIATSLRDGTMFLMICAGLIFAGWMVYANCRQSSGLKVILADTRAKVILDWWPVIVAAIVWIALLTNNLPQLPSLFGFDTDGHIDYIRHVQETGRLPLANEGWQMYQPPLYYLLSAGVLELVGLKAGDASATGFLRGMGAVIGFANVLLVFLSLRRLFPNNKAVQAVGTLFATCLPAQLYLSHYITNEGLAAALSTATLYFLVRTLQSKSASNWLYVATGGFLGLGMLSKFSVLVISPFVFGALFFQALRGGASGFSRWRGVLVGIFTCVLVCGWHYGRVWLRFGTPLVGNWSPESGFAWWQENGFTTRQYFLSFGRALSSPLFSGFHSFADGLYSTLWADGLCSGGARIGFRPPWNYQLMVVGCWLALLPSALILIGGLHFFRRWLDGQGDENILWPGLAGTFVLAIAAMTLRVPSYAQAKAVYALAALLPLVVCFVEGVEVICAGGVMRRWFLRALVILWMMISVAGFWIRGDVTATQLVQTVNEFDEGRFQEALSAAEHALVLDPKNATASSLKIGALRSMGRLSEARDQADAAHARYPHDPDVLLELAQLSALAGKKLEAASFAGEAANVAPDHPQTLQNAAVWNLEAGYFEEAIRFSRDALRVRYSDASLHLILGNALISTGNTTEGIAHLRLAVQIKPDWSLALNDLAWKLATHPDPKFRNGPEAVVFAEKACSLIPQRTAKFLATLAAAYAEAGRFSDAIATCESARDLALATGQEDFGRHAEQWLESYHAGRAVREPEDGPATEKNKPGLP